MTLRCRNVHSVWLFHQQKNTLITGSTGEQNSHYKYQVDDTSIENSIMCIYLHADLTGLSILCYENINSKDTKNTLRLLFSIRLVRGKKINTFHHKIGRPTSIKPKADSIKGHFFELDKLN